MGRSLHPTRRVLASRVVVGDVVLVRNPRAPRSTRWLLVDHASEHGAPHVWSGRWAFGGQWTIYTEHHDDTLYTVKDPRDAALDARRLESLPRAH